MNQQDNIDINNTTKQDKNGSSSTQANKTTMTLTTKVSEAVESPTSLLKKQASEHTKTPLIIPIQVKTTVKSAAQMKTNSGPNNRS